MNEATSVATPGNTTRFLAELVTILVVAASVTFTNTDFKVVVGALFPSRVPLAYTSNLYLSSFTRSALLIALNSNLRVFPGSIVVVIESIENSTSPPFLCSTATVLEVEPSARRKETSASFLSVVAVILAPALSWISTPAGFTTNWLSSRVLSEELVTSPANTILSSVFPATNLTSSAGPVFLKDIFCSWILTLATLIVPTIWDALNSVSSLLRYLPPLKLAFEIFSISKLFTPTVLVVAIETWSSTSWVPLSR